MKTHLLIKFTILLILIPLILTGCLLSPSGPKVQAEKVELEFWGVFDSSDAYENIIAAYQLARPNIKINYKKLRWQEYEQKLVEAWAEDRGPDIFLIHNTWVGKYQTKIEPLPEKLTVPVWVVSGGGLKKKTVKTEVKQINSPGIEQLKKIFVDTVWKDVVNNNQIWGLPLSVDTLALFYNQSLLDSAGVIEAPKTWEELTQAVKKITRQDSQGDIARSAIALGGADNIFRAFDILSLLMMQNGTQMTSANNKVTFGSASSYERSYFPGERALEFYTDFSQPFKEVYTWNSEMPEATDAFLQGKLAMMFGFAYQLPYLKAQGQHLNFSVAPMLHINPDGTDAVVGQSVNLASYWLLTAAKKTKHLNEVWDFILFASANNFKNAKNQLEYQAESYLNKTSKPPALRALINKYKQNPEMEPFVSQVLSAQNWYRGKDAAHVERIFKQMISDVVNGKSDVKEAIRYGVKAAQSTY